MAEPRTVDEVHQRLPRRRRLVKRAGGVRAGAAGADRLRRRQRGARSPRRSRAALGTRALLVTGATPARPGRWSQRWPAGLAPPPFPVAGEPTRRRLARAGAAAGARARLRPVIALGGGSALDAGKAIAALAGQRRRSARLPGGGRPRPAAGAARAAVHRRADHRGHRLRGHQERGARVARAAA